jgi:hypothetical protein
LIHNLETSSAFVTFEPVDGTGAVVGLAVVRSLDAPRSLESTQEREDFEQEVVDQFLLAAVGAGIGDSTVNENRAVIFEFAGFLGRPLWTAQPRDADAFLVRQRTALGRARLTVQHKAWSLARFYDFVLLRYQVDIHRLTGHVVIQVIDEFNRPARADYGVLRIPPAEEEVEDLFAAWRAWLPGARDPRTGWCCRVQDQALRDGLAAAVGRSLPGWSGRLTPHTLRHFCASSLYARGMDLKAIQELLGHEWLSTTTRYIHVHADHVERAWADANNRTAIRLGEGTR